MTKCNREEVCFLDYYLIVVLLFAGTFLRGVLDKVGVEPQVKRIGEFKSAGDQLLRKDMSEAQRTQLTELLDDIYTHFVETVAKARGKTEEVRLEWGEGGAGKGKCGVGWAGMGWGEGGQDRSREGQGGVGWGGGQYGLRIIRRGYGRNSINHP